MDGCNKLIKKNQSHQKVNNANQNIFLSSNLSEQKYYTRNLNSNQENDLLKNVFQFENLKKRK